MFRSIPAPVLEVIRLLKRNKYQAFLVGGCVRDMLQGVEPQDWDVATSAVPGIVQGLFPHVVPTGVQFGTVTVVHGGKEIEVTTFRRDGVYRDKRHPNGVIFGQDVEIDLLRRDFTFNAIAYDPIEEKLLDPAGGIKDLQAGILRAVGDSWERFGEDALRMLRAVRFAGQVGAEIEEETWRALCQLHSGLEHIAPERIRQELDKILLQNPLGHTLGLLEQSGLLGVIFPPLYKQTRQPLSVSIKSCTLVPPVLHLRLAGLLSGTGDPAPLLRSLRYDKKTIRSIEHLVTHVARIPPNGEDLAAARYYLCHLGPDNLSELVLLVRALVQAGGFEGAERDRVGVFLHHLDRAAGEDFPLCPAQLAIDGKMLMQNLHLAAGPVVGAILQRLWEEVLQDPKRNRREYLLARGRLLAVELENGKLKEGKANQV